MSAIVNPSLSFATGRVLRWASGIMLASAVRRLIRLKQDRQHLYELPDYILRDIGISRSEINSVTAFGGGDPSRRSRS